MFGREPKQVSKTNNDRVSAPFITLFAKLHFFHRRSLLFVIPLIRDHRLKV